MGLTDIIVAVGMVAAALYTVYIYRSRKTYETTYIAKPTDNCPICLEPMDNSDIRYIPCGHGMHQKCWGSLRKYYKNCPVCRSIF